MRNDPQAAAEKIAAKFRKTMPQVAAAGILPYSSKDGQWVTSPYDGNSWWTGGFWPGLMWQLWRMTGEDGFLQEEKRAEDMLTAEFRAFRYLNHDVGFMYLLSCGGRAKLLGDAQAKLDTLHAASLLMGRFNPVGYLRAWNGDPQKGFAIIDCMMNLSLLFRASREENDPRFAKIACIHADTALREFLRPDGSVAHIVVFDPETGKRIGERPGQGYALGTSWSRGQAWGLYGFTLAAMNTKDERYLAAAEKVAAYFIAHIRPDGLTDCDFCQPKDVERIDNIAGAVAACGLIELSRLTAKPEYQAAAEKLLDGLLDHCCDWSDKICGVLTHCTASYHDDGAGRHINITYGDYFFTEAIAKLIGTDPMLWI